MDCAMLDAKARANMRRNAKKAAAMLKMLSHEARLRVLCDLVEAEKTAGDLVASSGLGQSALSQHLAKLREEGLVKTRRDGQTIHYRLADTNTVRLIETLHELYCERK
jgi:DNA-binding transcriptional ArsR family regulator